MTTQRKKTYFKLNSELSSLSNKEVKALLKGNQVGDGWGKNHIIKVENKKVFVKSIPLTDLEYEHPYNTKNLYKLPLFYNYGVGSAGFGANRELLTHIKTTNWVLADECGNFPLMYHYRILKRDRPLKKLTKEQRERQDRYVNYWAGSKQVDEYITQRKLAKYELVIFLEFVPYNFHQYIKRNLSKIKTLSEKALDGFRFLNKKGIIHFDAHFHNILTDGKEVYITDFGLALDKEFNLTKRELEFYSTHINYDSMELIGYSSVILESIYHDQSLKKKKMLEKQFGITEELEFFERLNLLFDNFDKIGSLIKLSPEFITYVKSNKKTILKSNHFFSALRVDPKKKVRYKA